jgi:hypothetical protein
MYVSFVLALAVQHCQTTLELCKVQKRLQLNIYGKLDAR